MGGTENSGCVETLKMKRHILKVTLISFFVFGTLSFVHIVLQLESPINRQAGSDLSIGIPVIYYSQFTVGQCDLHHAWQLYGLAIDYALTWMLSWLLLRRILKNGGHD